MSNKLGYLCGCTLECRQYKEEYHPEPKNIFIDFSLSECQIIKQVREEFSDTEHCAKLTSQSIPTMEFVRYCTEQWLVYIKRKEIVGAYNVMFNGLCIKQFIPLGCNFRHALVLEFKN
jgi:hypothetical protein